MIQFFLLENNANVGIETKILTKIWIKERQAVAYPNNIFHSTVDHAGFITVLAYDIQLFLLRVTQHLRNDWKCQSLYSKFSSNRLKYPKIRFLTSLSNKQFRWANGNFCA